MKHHQTVARPRNDTPGWWATVWCVSTNCQLQILILKQTKASKLSKFRISIEILDCLKLKPDICINAIIPSQNAAFI